MTFLAGLKLDEYDTPVSGEDGDVDSDDDACLYHIVSISIISTGEEILLCTVDPAPDEAIEEAARLGLAIFTTAEIPHIKAGTAGNPDYIQQVIELKKVFPYSRIYKFSPEKKDECQ